MDKFVNKDCEISIGLDLLANHDKVSKTKNNIQTTKINRDFNYILDDFKKMLITKIDRYDPTKRRDDYDNYIRNIWFHYLLGNKSKEEYIHFFEYLGIKTNDTLKDENSSDSENVNITTE